MPGEDQLDLGGFDADAVHLDLGVGPSLVVQLAVPVPAGQVAGAVHAGAGGPEGAGDEPFRGRSSAPVVAPGERARHVQFAGHAGWDRGQFGSQDVGAQVGERPSDRGHAGLRRPARYRVAGDVEALGLSVGVDDMDVRERLVDRVDHVGGERVAAENRGLYVELQGARFLGEDGAEQRGEHGGYGADGAARPAVAFGEFEYVPDDLDARTGCERGEDLEHGDVEVHRGRGEHPGTLADLCDLPRVPDPVGDGGVGHGDALGRAGGPGGVHHVGQVVRVDADVLDVGEGAFGVVEIQVLDTEYGRPAVGKCRHLTAGQDQEGFGGVEQQVDPRGRVLGVDREVGAACHEDAELRDHQVRGPRQRHGHQHVGADPAGAQQRGQPAGAGAQFPVRQLGPRGHHRCRVRCASRLGGDEFRQGRPARGCGGVVQPCQAVPLGVGAYVHPAEPGRGVGDHLPEHPHIAVGDALGGGVVEQFRRVLQLPVGTPGGVRDDVEEQVEAGGVGARRDGGDPQARHLDALPHELPGQHDLEER